MGFTKMQDYTDAILTEAAKAGIHAACLGDKMKIGDRLYTIRQGVKMLNKIMQQRARRYA